MASSLPPAASIIFATMPATGFISAAQNPAAILSKRLRRMMGRIC
jgi:hypothetical protein